MIDFVKTKRIYIMALAILFVIVSLSGTTYSLFLKSDETNEFNYNTGLLDLQFTEDQKIVLENTFPMNDSEALKQRPYTLTIKNTGTLIYLFDLHMLSNSDDDNVIDSKYIKVKVNDGMPHSLYNANNVIASNLIIYPGEEITFKINIWLDILTPNNELGKTFVAKILTSGSSIYKTLDSSGANHPRLNPDMIPVYYDDVTSTWKKADSSNTLEEYNWYNYDDAKWANVVVLKDNEKQIYDVTRKNNLTVDNIVINNDNVVIDDKYLDINLSNYNYNNISNIFRIKFDDLSSSKVNIISNGNISYYYDVGTKKFSLKVGGQVVSSSTYLVDDDKWYIVGYTYDSNKVTFYADGEKISSVNIVGKINSDSSFKIGVNDTFDEVSKITVGDILVYNRILTDKEITNNYRSSVNIIYDGLVSGYNEFTPMTLGEYYLSRNVGTAINNKDVSAYYVWIPRFKYKLWNVTGESNIDSYDAYNKGIDIVFENNNTTSGVIYCKNNECFSDSLGIAKVTTNDNGKYYTHPAFKTQTDDMTGLWVSKYEVSTSSDTCNEDNVSGCMSNDLLVESKFGNTAWRNNNLSNFYQAIKKIDSENNYHVIRNSDWGAIAYLSHSKYGLCVNNSCKVIGTNNTYQSGNNIKDSTTDNIYGVFDMSGSASEFTMGNYADESGVLNLNNSYFKNIPLSNDDYELYYDNTFILGDATREITLENGIWYNNYANYINSTNNWFIRGGIGTTVNNGIFYYNATTDIGSDYITTRIILK